MLKLRIEHEIKRKQFTILCLNKLRLMKSKANNKLRNHEKSRRNKLLFIQREEIVALVNGFLLS